MGHKEIFQWLQEQMLVSEFIEWSGTQGFTPISRQTYYRATLYRNPETPDSQLPPRQQYALRLAKKFFEQKNEVAVPSV